MYTAWEHPVLFDRHLMEKFIHFAKISSDWKPGRQGTGYEILPVKFVPHLKVWVEYLAILVRQANTGDFWDAYLIRYLDGSYVPPHKDEASIYGMRHNRVNLILQNPTSGGEFLIDGKPPLDYNGEEIPSVIPEGDAYHFWPDEMTHEVTPVVGTRLILSVGAWV